MIKRKLGNSSLEIGPLVFGGNIFGWTVDEPTSFKLLDAFVASGLNFIDTADVVLEVGPGTSRRRIRDDHRQMAQAARQPRKVLIATKLGMEMGPGEDRASPRPTSLQGGRATRCKRLQTDYIDLYQSHRDDAETPMEETLAAFAELDQAGKSAGHRCVQFQGRPPRGSAARERGPRPSAL